MTSLKESNNNDNNNNNEKNDNHEKNNDNEKKSETLRKSTSTRRSMTTRSARGNPATRQTTMGTMSRTSGGIEKCNIDLTTSTKKYNVSFDNLNENECNDNNDNLDKTEFSPNLATTPSTEKAAQRQQSTTTIQRQWVDNKQLRNNN